MPIESLKNKQLAFNKFAIDVLDNNRLEQDLIKTSMTDGQFSQRNWQAWSVCYGEPSLILALSSMPKSTDNLKAIQILLKKVMTRVNDIGLDQIPITYFDGLVGLNSILQEVSYKYGGLNKARYQLNSAIAKRFPELMENFKREERHELDFDVVYGITGILAAQSRQKDDIENLNFLLTNINILVDIYKSKGIAAFTVDPRISLQSLAKIENPYYNMGFAHGLSGVLAALSVIAMNITDETKILTNILSSIGHFIIENSIKDGSSIFLPAIIDVEGNHQGRTRSAWCYGNPGGARAFSLAYRATGDNRFAQFAHALVKTALYEDMEDKRIDFDGVCHGKTGYLMNMYLEGNEPHNYHIHHQLITHLSQIAECVLEPGDDRDPSLLDGYLGVTAALNAIQNGEMQLPRLLLISV
ncbi:lanthionine synthetase LanC family protein [Deinococcus arboris]|nr:lanthionine synthetase LanC family protein [Deinococcus arboris]